jgi:anti-anti-sigma regulatory factor
MVLDLSGLSFMDGHSAATIIQLAGIPRLLGAESVDRLVLAEEGW